MVRDLCAGGELQTNHHYYVYFHLTSNSYFDTEPFFGGSHKAFLDGWIAHSGHTFKVLELPAYKWKWRMRGAAAYYANRIKDFKAYDAIFVTDMLDLTDLMSLGGKNMPPVLISLTLPRMWQFFVLQCRSTCTERLRRKCERESMMIEKIVSRHHGVNT